MITRNFEVGGFCAMLSGSPAERREVIAGLSALDQPVIVFQEALDSPYPDFCVVRQDDRAGGRLLADHLLARRVESYLVIVPRQGWPAVENRVAGLREGLLHANRSASITVIELMSESFADVQAAVARHLETNVLPGAMVGANDLIATAAMLYLIDRGHRIPEDVRIVGFNGFEAHRYSRPRLTTVISPAYAIGEQAGEAMLGRLATGTFQVAEYVLPVIFDPNSTT